MYPERKTIANRLLAAKLATVWMIMIFLQQMNDKCFGQMIGYGQCPRDLPVVTNFNLTRYLGIWYEQYRYFVIYQMGASCVMANYTKTEEGALGIWNSQYSKWEERNVSIRGVGKLDSVRNEAKIIVEFPDYGGKPAIYWVLGTDYTSYSVVWSCENANNFHLKFIWILTREQQPDKGVINKAIEILKNANISRKPLIRTDQNNCRPNTDDAYSENEVN